MLFLLPFIFSPLSLIIKWLPALYLAAWPIIIQTLGREALLMHAIVLILFILTCDITRQIMLKLIGFDLISLPAGIGLLAVLMSDSGSYLLSLSLPLFGWALTIVEPLFILIETIVIMEIISTFNKWISKISNLREDNSRDLSSWEPPLTRGAIVMRFLVILIAIASYLGSYMIVQETKTLLLTDASGQQLPIQFNQAIAMLVTLQLIAFSATMYKESGILSETAMVALIASVPIFISAWSFYHLKSELAASSTWTSYFPFTLFAGDGKSTFAQQLAGPGDLASQQNRQGVFFSATPDLSFHENDEHEEFRYGSSLYQDEFKFSFRAFERSLNSISPSDGLLKFALLTVVRNFAKLINSILGLSMEKLAKYYFGPDFWYILAARVACLLWCVLFGLSASAGQGHQSSNGLQASSPQLAGSSGPQSSIQSLRNLHGRFRARLPISQTTLVKILLVLAYAQMLIQQMENRQSLASTGPEANLLTLVDSGAADSNHHYYYHSAGQDGDYSSLEQPASELNYCAQASTQAPGLLDSSWRYVSCLLSSARACSTGAGDLVGQQQQQSKAARLLDWLGSLANSLLGALQAGLVYAFNRLANVHLIGHSIYLVWLSNWRSPIIQRLMQSMLLQAYYLCQLLNETPSDEEYSI